MKFRYLVVELDNGIVFGTNEEVDTDLLDDEIYAVIDTATDEVFTHASNSWEPIEEAPEPSLTIGD